MDVIFSVLEIGRVWGAARSCACREGVSSFGSFASVKEATVKPHSLLVAVVIGAGISVCGGSGGSDETCIDRIITYSGSHRVEPAYLRISQSDGGRLGVYGADIGSLISGESGNLVCWRGGDHVDILFVADAWIDVSGAAAANSCDNLAVPNPACKPAAGDPQAHQSGVIRFGQITHIRFDVVDPP